MLDLRIYRVAFAPALIALVLVAFSLQSRPRPIETTLPPDAFDGPRAAALLEGLAERYPQRRPGSEGDRALAGDVQRAFEASGFTVTTDDAEAQTIDGERTLRTVVAERPGRVNRRIVVLAHRDAAGSPARAELSATAALLELARLYGGRATRRTLTLVSTSGGSGGDAGAAHWARSVEGPVDAVIVLGDVGGDRVRRPQVVGWSNAQGIAPQRLLRTVEQAIREETTPPGSSSPLMQLLRLAFPATVSEQGVIDAAGLPAVMVGASGELGPPASPAGEAVSPQRLEALGRAVLRSITALDDGPEVTPTAPRSAIVLRNQVLADWAVRLLAGTLLLPVLIAAVDALARVRRRREPVLRWVGWAAATGVPFLLTGLTLVVLRLLGLVTAPGAPVRPGLIPVSVPALIAAGAVFVLAFVLLWPLTARRLALGGANVTGAAIAIGLTTLVLTGLAWLVNPYTALFLVPAAHLWLLANAPEVKVPRPARVVLVLAGLIPLALAVLGYAVAFDAGPLDLLWMGTLMVAGGHIGILALVFWSLVAGCAVAALIVAARTRGAQDDLLPRQVRSRGPISYAGPGSLGGTDSTLRP
ncbi:hypothetical protein [Capillimicrobium parvum]|uniref:Peptidase M28 domain-containing protein n=1 Tax=Capillimicrobium parvum TaxID=2884022 RepID=A0A9E6Y3X7_9ACTN|nr:hypothetical protein [Capillimicrobium parvum]UGS39275.1 hypothetical protein DSM104329_05709 [Capillimicrobium parvum]